MNLENKERVEFVDSHLWAQAARFCVSIQIKHIAYFFGILSDFQMTVHPHMDESDDQSYFVNVEFVPQVMVAGRTEQKLLTLIALGREYGGHVTIILDDICAKIDDQGNILERWENERAVV